MNKFYLKFQTSFLLKLPSNFLLREPNLIYYIVLKFKFTRKILTVAYRVTRIVFMFIDESNNYSMK